MLFARRRETGRAKKEWREGGREEVVMKLDEKGSERRTSTTNLFRTQHGYSALCLNRCTLRSRLRKREQKEGVRKRNNKMSGPSKMKETSQLEIGKREREKGKTHCRYMLEFEYNSETVSVAMLGHSLATYEIMWMFIIFSVFPGTHTTYSHHTCFPCVTSESTARTTQPDKRKHSAPKQTEKLL